MQMEAEVLTFTPMRTGAKKRYTYEDLRDIPDGTRAEILGGELIVSPHPTGAHNWASYRLSVGLDPFVGPPAGASRPGGWWVMVEPELHLGDDVLIPDLAAWRYGRVPGPYDGAFTTVAPDWVCEVLSPSTSRVDRERKLPIFAREGVQHAWLIDPRRRTIDVHRLVRGTLMRVHTYREEPPPARIEPFEAVGLALGNLWIPSFSH